MDSSITGNDDSKLTSFTRTEDVFKLLEDRKHASPIYCKEIILLLGNTGTGKTTFSKFIATDNTKLKSIEIVPGGGDYIIEDDDNKIGHEIKSKTILPEQVIDLDSGIAYCDCPGFGDTRNSAHDIASTYYIKNLLDHAKSVKIVLMVLHSSVRTGYDRIDFMVLIKHMIEFMKNIENFKDNIVLVVSKVEDYNKTKEQIIINIVHFLGTVKETLTNDLKSANSTDYQEHFNKKAISFIDIFLTKTVDKYDKILIFRKPCEGGILSNIKLLQDDKTYLKTLLENSIAYAPITEDDFGFTVSATSKNDVTKLVTKINEDITFEIERVTQDLNNYIKSHIKDTDDFHTISEKFNVLQKNLKKTIEMLEKSITIKEFIVTLTKYMDGLNIKNYRNTFLNMLKNWKYLQFLEKIIDEKVAINIFKWSHPLRDIIQEVEKSKQWYSFLFNMYEKLSYGLYRSVIENKEDIQREIRGNCKKPGDKIIYLLRKCNIGYNFDIDDIDEIKTRHLYDMLQVLFTDISFEHTDSNTLLVKGDFIKLSDIEIHLNVTTQEIKCIEIFALKIFFVDIDFIKLDSQMKLFVIAPPWEVINDRRIVLDGSPGAAFPCSKAEEEQDGLPGRPGSSSGSFIGIGHKIINGNQLTISANGGIGGAGQDGGDGRPGTDGYNEEPCGSRENGKNIMSANNGYKKIENCNEIMLGEWQHYCLLAVGVTTHKDSECYVVHGNNGTNGSDGGQGGCGGKGGFGGIVHILGLPQEQIKISNQNGIDGNAGRGGKGGVGGKNVGDVIYECQELQTNFLYFIPVSGITNIWHKKISKVQQVRAASGRDNTDTNVQGIEQPESVKWINIWRTINRFKMYALQNLNNSVKKYNLIQFYLYLHHNTNIEHYYNALGFVDELQNYETVFHQIHKFYELDKFYELLLQRIIKFTKDKNEISIDKTLFNYLYTATLSKIVIMKDRSGEGLIIDIDKYLKHVLNNLKTLQKGSHELIKLECSRDYTQNIQEKIKEALQFIENHITSEIEVIFCQVEDKLEHLLNDILKLRENAETEKRFLQQKKKEVNQLTVQNELLTNIWLHKFLNIILICAKTVGSIIQTASKVIHSLALNNSSTYNVIQTASKIAVCLGLDKLGTNNVIGNFLTEFFKQGNNGTDLIKKLVTKKCEALLQFLDNVLQHIDQFPGNIIDISLVKLIRENVNYFMENVDNCDITSYLLEITSNFEKLKQMFNNSIQNCVSNTTLSKSQITPQILHKLKTWYSVINIAELLPNIYDKYKLDELKLVKLDELIQQKENKINSLQQFELVIFNRVFPLFVNIQNDIKKLEGQSHVALNISNWKIQSSFKEMHTMLTRVSKEFQMAVELEVIVDRLKETIFTQIHIYDRIQEYSEHKELADYIANMVSEQDIAIRTGDTVINQALTRLDFTIKSNIVMGQFVKTLNAFKQFIFPFANYYIKEFNSVIDVDYKDNYENIIADMRDKIERIKAKLSEKNSSVNITLDHCVVYENFSSGINFNKPFYCWDNEKFETAITYLLSGEEILLKSDILHSFPDKDAIKFNEIHINLKTRNTSLNAKMRKALEHFDVEMTHYGNSYFRFDNKFYILSSDKMTFRCSFGKDENRNPVRENEVNRKIKAKHYILSPYATWSFRLKAVHGANFKDLKEFKGKVDLELVGHGQYVGMENDISGEELQKYYKCIDVMSVTDVIDNIN